MKMSLTSTRSRLAPFWGYLWIGSAHSGPMCRVCVCRGEICKKDLVLQTVQTSSTRKFRLCMWTIQKALPYMSAPKLYDGLRLRFRCSLRTQTIGRLCRVDPRGCDSELRLANASNCHCFPENCSGCWKSVQKRFAIAKALVISIALACCTQPRKPLELPLLHCLISFLCLHASSCHTIPMSHWLPHRIC